MRNLCKKGDACDFLHFFDVENMPVCHFFPTLLGCQARDGECNFLHVDPTLKIKDCPWYARGFCKNGPDCRHRHAKKVLCRSYLCGFCPDGNGCKYAHPAFDLPVNTDFVRNAPTQSNVSQSNDDVTGPGSEARLAPYPTQNVQGVGAINSYGSFGPIICKRCNAHGHKSTQCPLAVPGEVIICHACNAPGHKAPQCPLYESFKPFSGADGGLKRIPKCYTCGVVGHTNTSCPNNRAAMM